LIGSNHKVCVQAFGGAEDPSQFSIACRQVGPIIIDGKLPKEETAFNEGTSLFLKKLKSAGCLTPNATPWSMSLSAEN